MAAPITSSYSQTPQQSSLSVGQPQYTPTMATQTGNPNIGPIGAQPPQQGYGPPVGAPPQQVHAMQPAQPSLGVPGMPQSGQQPQMGQQVPQSGQFGQFGQQPYQQPSQQVSDAYNTQMQTRMSQLMQQYGGNQADPGFRGAIDSYGQSLRQQLGIQEAPPAGAPQQVYTMQQPNLTGGLTQGASALGGMTMQPQYSGQMNPLMQYYQQHPVDLSGPMADPFGGGMGQQQPNLTGGRTQGASALGGMPQYMPWGQPIAGPVGGIAPPTGMTQIQPGAMPPATPPGEQPWETAKRLGYSFDPGQGYNNAAYDQYLASQRPPQQGGQPGQIGLAQQLLNAGGVDAALGGRLPPQLMQQLFGGQPPRVSDMGYGTQPLGGSKPGFAGAPGSNAEAGIPAWMQMPAGAGGQQPNVFGSPDAIQPISPARKAELLAQNRARAATISPERKAELLAQNRARAATISPERKAALTAQMRARMGR